MRVGRNDPCPCGSGKKYKRCCLPKQQVVSLREVRGEREHIALLTTLMEAAAELPPEEGVAAGMLRFYAGDPPLERMKEGDFFEPLDWALFAYRMPGTGETPAQRVARDGRRLSRQQREQVLSWCAGAVAGVFHVVQPGPGEVHLRRLVDEADYVVTDDREGLHTGDTLAGWLLPTPEGLRFGCDSSLLPEGASRPRAGRGALAAGRARGRNPSLRGVAAAQPQ